MSFIKFTIMDSPLKNPKNHIKAIFINSTNEEKILILQTEENIETVIEDLRSSKLLDLVSSAYGNFIDVKLYRENECLVERKIDKDVSTLMHELINRFTTGRVNNQVRAISNLHSFFEGKKDHQIAESIQSFKDFHMNINRLEKNIFLNGEIGDGEFFKTYIREDESPRGEDELGKMNEFKQIYDKYYSLLPQNSDLNRPLNNFLNIVIEPYKLMKKTGEINNSPKIGGSKIDTELDCSLWLLAFSLIFSEISSEDSLNEEGCNMLAFLAIYRSYEFLLNATFTELKNAVLKNPKLKNAALENAALENAALEKAMKTKLSEDNKVQKPKKTNFNLTLDLKISLIKVFLKPLNLESNSIFNEVFDDTEEEKPFTFQFLKKNRNNFFLIHGTRYVDRKTVKEYIKKCKKLVFSLEKDALFDIDNPEKRPFNSKYEKLKEAHFYNLSHLFVEEILHSFSLKIQFTNADFYSPD